MTVALPYQEYGAILLSASCPPAQYLLVMASAALESCFTLRFSPTLVCCHFFHAFLLGCIFASEIFLTLFDLLLDI
jgi:hypothetical protein